MTAFKKPIFELIEFNANDVIATSGQPGGGGDCAPHCPDFCAPVCDIVCSPKQYTGG